MTISERLLIHGPCLRDLTDLLYFDKIIHPTITALLRPQDLPPGYVGYPAQEPIPEDATEKLKDAGLIVSPGELLFSLQAGEVSQSIESGADTIAEWAGQMGKYGADLFQNSYSTLEPPLNNPTIRSWLADIHQKTKRTSEILRERNSQATIKYYNEDIATLLQPGWDIVLGVILPLPCLSVGVAPIEDIIGFLKDRETLQKRADLLNWNRLTNTISANADMIVEAISDLMRPAAEAYLNWLHGSELVSGLREAEFLVTAGKSLEQIEIEYQSESFKFAKRGLSLAADEQTGGQELAYVTYAKRNWRDWFPGLIM